MSKGSAGTGAKRRREITQEVAVRIFEYLESEQPPAGTHMTAQELADRLEVSRSPIIQALKLLSDKGIVVHERNRGYFTTGGIQGPARKFGIGHKDAMKDVYFRIAEDRLSGELEDQVSETYLRERYGLTRGQLTTLLNRISSEGWAERRHGYGWSFSPILTTAKALEQTYSLRLALEPKAILEPTFNLPPEMAARWRAREEELLAGKIEVLSADALYEFGVSFHEMLAEASGNPFFLQTLKQVNKVRRLLTYRSMDDRSRYYRQAKEHIMILDLLSQGKKEEASEALHEHLEHVVQNLRKLRARLDR